MMLRLAILALCFSAGVILGQVLAGQVPSGTDRELEQYLTDFFALERDDGFSRQELLSAVLIYFRYPLLAFLLGFSSIGCLLLPAVTAAYGFFLSFSVCCFAASFGKAGVLLALAVFGLRCLLTLPCYFALAVPSLHQAAALAAASFGQGKRVKPVRYGGEWWFRLGVVALCLLAGVFAELFLAPAFVALVLDQIL